MAKYILECPECQARFNLKKHVAGKRVRCKKCRIVMIIPELPGQAPVLDPAGGDLAPEMKEKLASILSLRKLTLVSAMLAAALIAGTFILIKRAGGGVADATDKAPDEPMSFAKIALENHKSPFPLSRGYEWTFVTQAGQEEVRRVSATSSGPDKEPQFEMSHVGPSESLRWLLRCTNDGVYVVEETRSAGGKVVYDPPMPILKRPLFVKDDWTYTGTATGDGGRSRAVSLEFKVPIYEQITTPLGTYSCFRVDVEDSSGPDKVTTVFWYAFGIGLVKYARKVGDVLTDFSDLRSFKY